MFRNIMDQEDEKFSNRDKCFNQVQDDELSIDSHEVNAYGSEDAKKLAIQRVRDAWKIEAGQLVLSKSANGNFVQIQTKDDEIIEPENKKNSIAFDITIDHQNHPIHQPDNKTFAKREQVQNVKFTNQIDTDKINLEKAQIQKSPSDAFILRQKFTKKRDAKMKIKLQTRLFKTLRLKPSVINTGMLMQEIKPSIKNFDPTMVDQS